MTNPPETPKGSGGSGNKKEDDSPKSHTTEETVDSSSVGANTGSEQKDSGPENRHIETDEEDMEQDRIPEEIRNKIHTSSIRNKTYTSLDAYYEDLENYGLEDCKYIELGSDGNVRLKMPPGKFHRESVDAIESEVKNSAKASHFKVLVRPEPVVYTGDIPVENCLDLGIWGRDRIDDRTPLKARLEAQPGQHPTLERMNPNVIIAFSWSNKLEDEISKFNDQMHMHKISLGKINVGFLIKAIPLKKNCLPRKRTSQGDVKNFPLLGFDVFRAEADEDRMDVNSKPYLEYRAGGEDKVIEITDKDLGDEQTGRKVCISLSVVQTWLENYGVVFLDKPANEREPSRSSDEQQRGAVV